MTALIEPSAMSKALANCDATVGRYGYNSQVVAANVKKNYKTWRLQLKSLDSMEAQALLDVGNFAKDGGMAERDVELFVAAIEALRHVAYGGMMWTVESARLTRKEPRDE